MAFFDLFCELILLSLLPPACARFSGGLGLQNYECIINGTIMGGGASGPNAIFKGFITTGVGCKPTMYCTNYESSFYFRTILILFSNIAHNYQNIV